MRENPKLKKFKKEYHERHNKKQKALWFDEKLSLKERKRLFEEYKEAEYNPIHPDDFDPDKWNPNNLDGKNPYAQASLIPPYPERKVPSFPLPTHGIKPKRFGDTQMVGNGESKQEIYLTFAWCVNILYEEIKALEKRITQLENKP